jgi:hypothetical protein
LFTFIEKELNEVIRTWKRQEQTSMED